MNKTKQPLARVRAITCETPGVLMSLNSKEIEIA